MPRKPKPPTPMSVSATLRADGYRAYLNGRDEGYLVEWSGMPGASAVRVNYKADDESLRKLALEKMTSVLARKGWAVTLAHAGRLLVTEA